ncbi:glycosyltransferase family 39 protein [Edaphobacter sp. 12200R-103]|uniref:ArnT family glycosyltransferase n=1 Tax=Edaphobacter sp. 12200R-103 TaxID=2703788 RepID=UPI00138BC3EF|nr:glycosyltransferase family 39 protein [Edaphobacter sp. 12200R-103]QHS53518.1 glycosyltransferase family 39 protein [Edaphobacter sp. 12200R-103]
MIDSQPSNGQSTEGGGTSRGRLYRLWKRPEAAVSRELLILVLVSGFLLLYGLIPMFGGDQLGLVGADEPRYAQVAREMLEAHSEACHEVKAKIVPHSLRLTDLEASYHCLMGGTVTPILYGQPWLEKPALYYWRAMGFFKEFGVSDWSARLPSSSGAFALIFLIFLHMRRFRPGGHLDAALMTMSSVAIFSFSRGASTDMQLAAPFCIGMLGWYAWYETGKKFWLFDLYFFGAAATLAKGPVAPFLALSIILLFAGLRREWSLLRRTIWVPGLILYFAMVLPWYLAVQLRNPSFFRVFFKEHNLERFATNRYQHHQPVWYYVAVLIIGLMPWTVIAIRALVDSIAVSIAEWKVRHNPKRYLGHTRAGDAFPEFLVLWALFPIVFFSFSGSKLPGYILPSIPPLTILTGDYLNRMRHRGLPGWLQWGHAATTAVLVFVLTLAPQHMKYETLVPSAHWLLAAGAAALGAALLIFFVGRHWGISQLTNITLIPSLAVLVFLLGFHGRDLDINYSARPLAREMARKAPDVKTVAVESVRRDLDYGIAFYRNQPTVHYSQNGVPTEEHLLVIPTRDTAALEHYLSGRMYTPLFLYDTQGLEVYRVAAKP